MRYLILCFLGCAALGSWIGCGSQLAPVNSMLIAPTLTPCAPPAVRRINCGDNAYTGYCSAHWSADQPYSGNSWGYVGTTSVGGPGGPPILNTNDQPLFYKERYASTLEYDVDVPAGSYNVTLWFSEGYWTASGKRVFDVVVEGVTVVSGLDVFAVAGPKTAYAVNTIATVSDGTLNIVLTASADNAEINAIEVR
ncbi:MAG: malectin domain-containing carbohydrate-binding protein [candidate division FCPU426 bacterium]